MPSVEELLNQDSDDETNTGKFTLEFPANYTGKITAKILGR